MTFVRPGFPGPQSLICSPMIFHLHLLCCLVVLTFYLSLKNLRGWIQLKPWSKRQLLVASCTAAQAARLTGFREGKSSVSWRSLHETANEMTARETRRGRQHVASPRHAVMDGAHRLINQRWWKGRMLRRGRRCHARRRVGNVGAGAWPDLAWLMKNGQESAYLARLPSTQPPLLISSSCSPKPSHLYPPCPFHSLRLPDVPTLWSVLLPDLQTDFV